MAKSPNNPAASIRQRLLNLAREEGRVFDAVLVAYGMERCATQTAFAEFLNDRSLNIQQMRFVEMVIDQLTARGVMKV